MFENRGLTVLDMQYMDRHLRSVAIMIEVTSRHMECTHFNPDYSRMPAVALQL